jgi:hypothetical protein
VRARELGEGHDKLDRKEKCTKFTQKWGSVDMNGGGELCGQR